MESRATIPISVLAISSSMQLWQCSFNVSEVTGAPSMGILNLGPRAWQSLLLELQAESMNPPAEEDCRLECR